MEAILLERTGGSEKLRASIPVLAIDISDGDRSVAVDIQLGLEVP